MSGMVLIEPTTDAEPYIIRAGQIVIVHRNFSFTDGPQECIGIFKATRDFDPVAEHRLYQSEHPDAGPPQTWSLQTRQHYASWSVTARGYLEDCRPTYLFLEPFEAELPGTKVAHESL